MTLQHIALHRVQNGTVGGRSGIKRWIVVPPDETIKHPLTQEI